MTQPVDPLQTMDAMVWADEFMRLFGQRKDEIDNALMLAWFANAIMRGYDEATRRNASALADERRRGLEEAAQNCRDQARVYSGGELMKRNILINMADYFRAKAQAKEK